MNRSTNKINHQKAARIIAHYSAAHQLIKLCEECGELIQQAAKCYDKGEAYSDEFAEELADVTVLTMQFEGFFSAYQRQRYRDYIREKLDRQLQRIESEVHDDP